MCLSYCLSLGKNNMQNVFEKKCILELEVTLRSHLEVPYFRDEEIKGKRA